MVFSPILERKSNIKMKNLGETKFMTEHDFQMMNLRRLMTYLDFDFFLTITVKLSV